jgi:hypothetical protein
VRGLAGAHATGHQDLHGHHPRAAR